LTPHTTDISETALLPPLDSSLRLITPRAPPAISTGLVDNVLAVGKSIVGFPFPMASEQQPPSQMMRVRHAVDELDKSMDLLDEEQELHSRARQHARRDLVDNMPDRGAAFRRTVLDRGLQVDVVELSQDGEGLAWLPARMRMQRVVGQPEELMCAQVVWEVDRARGALEKGRKLPKPLPMAFFHAINRGVRRVRVPYELEVGDVSRVATVTARPEPGASRRALVLRFETGEQRDDFVDGLRRLWGEVQDGLTPQQPPETPPTLTEAAITVSSAKVVPYEDAARVMLSVQVAARKEARALYGEVSCPVRLAPVP
jgi:hypothetical protein